MKSDIELQERTVEARREALQMAEDRLRKLKSYPIWDSGNGLCTPIAQMDNQHLINSILLLGRGAVANNGLDIFSAVGRSKLMELAREATKRVKTKQLELDRYTPGSTRTFFIKRTGVGGFKVVDSRNGLTVSLFTAALKNALEHAQNLARELNGE